MKTCLSRWQPPLFVAVLCVVPYVRQTKLTELTETESDELAVYASDLLWIDK